MAEFVYRPPMIDLACKGVEPAEIGKAIGERAKFVRRKIAEPEIAAAIKSEKKELPERAEPTIFATALEIMNDSNAPAMARLKAIDVIRGKPARVIVRRKSKATVPQESAGYVVLLQK